jgi:hypothetical protein
MRTCVRVGKPVAARVAYANGHTLPAGFQPGIPMNVFGIDMLDNTRKMLQGFEARLKQHRSSGGTPPEGS